MNRKSRIVAGDADAASARALAQRFPEKSGDARTVTAR
jgi:hypothetical protein